MTINPTSRDYNKAAVLDVMLERAPLTRSELIELTGLSKATVSRAVEELRGDGFVVDGGVDVVMGRGRRSTYLDVPGTAGHIVGIGYGAQTTCVLVTDLRGREVQHVIVPTLDEDEAQSAARWLVDLIGETSESAEGPVRQVIAAVPGRVRDGKEIFGPAESTGIFSGPALQRAIEDMVDAPVLLESDANASLLGILTEDATVGDAVLLVVSTMLNFASCSDHEIARGRTPSFGDVGVLCSGVDEEPLDGLLSATGLLRFARGRGLGLERIEALWLEPRHDAARAEVLEAFTTAMVTAVRAVAVTLDPESVYIAGRLCPLVDEVLPEVHRQLAQSLPSVPKISVVTQVLGLSVARGAACAGLAMVQGRIRDAVLEARRQAPAPHKAVPAF